MEDPSLNTWRQNSRFKNLLNPVRDQSAAWAVDIAEHLVEYAQSIGLDLIAEQAVAAGVTSSPSASVDTTPSSSAPSSPTSVDFAQAALILQGSTTLYSRKIEHLYSLAFAALQTMNQLNNDGDRNNNSKKKRRNQNGDDGDDDGNNDGDDTDDGFNIDQVNFLSLDDDGGDGIEQAEKALQLQNIRDQNTEIHSGGANEDPTRLRPVPPMLRQNVDPSAGNLDRANYKMCTAFTHASGALLTDGCPRVNENLEVEPERLSPHMSQPQQDQNQQQQEQLTSSTPGLDDDIHIPDLFGDDDNDHGDDNNNDSNEMQPPIISQTMESNGADILLPNSQNGVDIESAPPSPRSAQAMPELEEEEEEDEDERIDPFELLNPHEEYLKMVRPMRVRVPRARQKRKDARHRRMSALYSRDDGIDEQEKERNNDTGTSDVCALIEAAIGAVPRNATLTSYVCVAAARAPVQTIVRKRRRERREREQAKSAEVGRCNQRSRGRREDRVDLEDIDVLNDVVVANEGHGDFDGNDDDDADSETDVQVTRGAGDGLPENVDGRRGDAHEDINLFHDEEDVPEGGGGIDNGIDGGEMLDMGIDFVGGNALAVGHNNGTLNDENSLKALASRYAETCAKYLAQTAWMWEKRVVDSRLTQRVEEWTGRIHPVLEREEEREEFDIRKSGQRIVDRLREEKRALRKESRLSTMIQAHEKYEVCRSFLATLQLANNGVVEIVREPEHEGMVCNPGLQLLLEEEEEQRAGEKQNMKNGGNNIVSKSVFETPLGKKKANRKRTRIYTPGSDRRRPLRARLLD